MGTFTSKIRTAPYEKKLRNVEDYDIKHLFTDDVLYNFNRLQLTINGKTYKLQRKSNSNTVRKINEVYFMTYFNDIKISTENNTIKYINVALRSSIDIDTDSKKYTLYITRDGKRTEHNYYLVKTYQTPTVKSDEGEPMLP
jgi:hypothetical protein